MKPLHQLVEQHRALQQLDLEEIDEQTLLDTLEGLQGEITIKAQSCAATVRNMESFADAIDAAVKQMQDRSAKLRKKVDFLRGYLLSNMQAADITKIQAPEFTIAIRRNSPAVQIQEGAQIPDEYMVIPEPPPPRPDKRKIAEALKSGQAVHGCQLVQGERLEIK